MINDIYNRKILGFAADIPRLQRLEAPDATAVAHSRLCGSKVTVDVAMKDDVVSDFGHEVKACALGQASSSIMARHVDRLHPGGAPQRARPDVPHAEGGGPAPTGKWADLEALLPVQDFKARHASTLLTFDAVVDAVNQIEAKAGSMSILDAKGTVVPRSGTSTLYLPQFAHVVQGREKRVLGDCFWANPVWCKPHHPCSGSASALRHWHAREDEFVFGGVRRNHTD